MLRRFWVILIFTLLSNVTVALTDSSSVLVSFRWVICLLFSLFLPGYCLLDVLFPSNEIGSVIRVCLSIFLSFCIVALVGLFVNYIFGAITILNLMVFISFVNIVLAVIKVINHNNLAAQDND